MSDLNEKIVQLVDMGFTAAQALKALKVSNNNVESAISYLFEDRIEVDDNNIDSGVENKCSTDTVEIRNPLDIPDLTEYSQSHQQHQREVEESDTDKNSNSSNSSIGVSDDETKIEANVEHQENINEEQITMSESYINEAYGDRYKQLYHPRNMTFHKSDVDGTYRLIEKYAGDENIALPQNLDEIDDESLWDGKVGGKLILPENPIIKIENEFVPFIIILTQLNKFQDILFDDNFQFKDYGWDSNWYNRGSQGLNTLLPTDIPILKSNSYKLIVEIQRIIGFLSSSLSDRQIISNYNLLRALRQNKVISQDEEFDDVLIEELIPKMYECINNSILTLNEESKEQLDSLFKSVVRSEGGEDEEDQTNNVYHLDIESNRHHSNFYDSFNELIWGFELEQLGNIYFANISDMISITKLSEGSQQDWNQNFEVMECFYPQIYTSKYKDLIISMNNEKERLVREKIELVKKLNKLNFFEGKKVSSILEKTIKLFSLVNEEVSNELSHLSSLNKSEKQCINEELENISHSIKKLDILYYENILERIEAEDKLIPYELVGFISKLNSYCYRINGTKRWMQIDFSIQNDKDFANLETKIYENFEEIRGRLLECRFHASTTYIYVKKDVLESERVNSIPHGLEVFFDRDNKLYRKKEEEDVEVEVEVEAEAEGEREGEENIMMKEI